MFKDLYLQATYSSYEDDLGEGFYTPVLTESIKYDRATAYFSAKALSHYAKGLEFFAKKNGIFRLIVSTEISIDEYNQIKAGYDIRDTIDKTLALRLREELTLEEERGISNLSYLISIGVIDVKMAFTTEGIFHDKFGIVEDENGDIICFRGSNNETTAAFLFNYESFDITCSWQASEFDYSKITKSQETFNKLWSNETDKVCVREIGQVIYSEIEKFNKGCLLIDETELARDCLLLDFDNRLILDIKIDPEIILNNSIYKLKLRRYVDLEYSTSDKLMFKNELTYPDYKRIISLLEKDSKNRSYSFFVTVKLKKYILERELFIEKRANLGIAIKQKKPELNSKYEEYKMVVNSALHRKLRDSQMWDSFFMYTMKKSSNFSVPGSGKTASVLGVIAYMKAKGIANRIVMIGPKNSFVSWSDEFNLTFGHKLNLKLFNIQDKKFKSTSERRSALLHDIGDANLILLNYDSLRTYISEAKKLIDNKTLLVFDEVHKVKALEGINASKALEISKNALYTIALTGTPIPNSYADIRNLLEILYHDEYNEFFGFSNQQLKFPSSKDVEMINTKLQPFFCRTTKKQLSVPEVNPDIYQRVKASSLENSLFSIICKKYAKKKLVLIVRLLQLESNPAMLLKSLDLSEFADILDISGTVDEIDYFDYSNEVASLIKNIDKTAKFIACIDLIKSLYDQGKNIIVWCIFVDSIHRIAYELSKFGIRVGCIYGETSMEDRQVLIEMFKSGKLNVLITNPHTLAESVSLHKSCHDAVYFEYTYNLVHLLQSKDRIHRLGLPDDQYTQYYYLQEHFTTDDHEQYSLDEQILTRLYEKENTMLEAIENNKLETATTIREDLEFIFKSLKLRS